MSLPITAHGRAESFGKRGKLAETVRSSGGQVRVCELAAPQARALAVAHRRRADALLSQNHLSVCAAARSLPTVCRLLAETRRHRSARRPNELTCFCGTTGANVSHCSAVCVKSTLLLLLPFLLLLAAPRPHFTGRFVLSTENRRTVLLSSLWPFFSLVKDISFPKPHSGHGTCFILKVKMISCCLSGIHVLWVPIFFHLAPQKNMPVGGPATVNRH